MTETQPADLGGTADTRTYEGTPRLNAALATFQSKLPRIEKGKTATVPTKQGGQYSYSYADLADVADIVKPRLGEVGLAFTAWPTIAGNRCVLRYLLVHESGEERSGEYPLPSPMDVGAQAFGSAITYARRYTLCAVTGVAPDDDDDAAAVDARRQAEQAAEQAEYYKEYNHAVESVMGAWANQYGGWDQEAASAMFGTWSKGGTLKQASPAQLRAFTGFLLSLPAEDAGSTPITEPSETVEKPEAPNAGRYRDPGAPLSADQRTRIIASLNELGIRDRQDRLQWMSDTLGRKVASTNDLTMAEAGQLIDTLNGGVTVLEGGES